MKRIYLNNAATSFPKPPEVINAVEKYLTNFPYNGRRGDADGNDLLLDCRKKVALFFGITNYNDLIFSSGATESLNLVIKGLPLNGKHVVTTSIEHNSVIRPLKALEREGKISLTIVACDHEGNIKLDDIKNAINPKTALLIVSHGSNVTGTCNVLKSMADIAHNAGALFAVDASQTVGVIPINVKSDSIDLLAFTGHKGLFGLQGCGGLYIRDTITLKPLKTGGTGVKSELLTQPQESPILYESGTLNLPGIISMSAGVDFINMNGMQNIQNHHNSLLKSFRASIDTNKKILQHGKSEVLPIASVNIDGMNPEDVCYALSRSFGIEVRSGLHCSPLIHNSLGTYPKGTVRVSLSWFTTQSDIDTTANALHQLSGI
jgi:cysteine desulfurase family protein